MTEWKTGTSVPESHSWPVNWPAICVGAGTPPWASPVGSLDPQAAVLARNSAPGALMALLLGLLGSVIGGWIASGEPMTFTYHRTRAVASGNVR